MVVAVAKRGYSCRFTILPDNNVAPLAFTIFLTSFLTSLPLVLTFNIDTRNAFIVTGPNQSYFGYSLALFQHQDKQRPMLIVGAPKYGQKRIYGEVYNCSVEQGDFPCQSIKLPDPKLPRYSKSEHWIGGTIDTNEQKNRVAVCAHRFTFIVEKSVRVIGVCYELSYPFDQEPKVLECKGEQKKNGVFFYGFAQFGTSMKYSKDNRTLLIGTPGLYQGKGGFVIHRGNDRDCKIVDYSDDTKSIVHTDDPYEYQMVGYSITSGKYFNHQIYTVVGAPGISTSGLGKIYIYSGDILFQYYTGTQFGSGFGSSLISADLTGDGNDDLIVGAPYQYSIRNEGRVHVFISTGWGLFQRLELSGDNIINAHFGIALGNLGDINKDGFEDIVVGAPYEDDCGAIYIYFGNHLKLSEVNRQKIVGKTLDSKLKGFGISFSKPMDIDGNGYDDFLTGAFLSDQAVLLYSREIKAESSFTTDPEELDPSNAKCFGHSFTPGCLTLKMCITLMGKNLKNITTHINIGVDVEQEETKKRVALEGPKIINIILDSEKKICTTIHLKTRKTNDIFSSVFMQFRVSYHINDTSIDYSVKNLLDTTVLRKEIPFVTECGTDKVCNSDIVTNLQVVKPRTNDILLIGDTPVFHIRVTVRNVEEPAYQPVGTLNYPLYVQYTPNTATNGVNCSVETIVLLGTEQNKVVVCNLKNPIRREDFTYNMTFEIKEENFTFGTFPMKFSVTSKSEERCEENDAVKLMVKMRKKAQLIVNPSSEPQFIVVSDKRNKSSEIQTVVHEYVFYNDGPSELTKVAISGSVQNIEQNINGKLQKIIEDANEEITQTETFPLVVCTMAKSLKRYHLTCEVEKFLKASSFNLRIKLKLFTRFTGSDLPPILSNVTIAAHKDKQYVTGMQNTEIFFQVETKLKADRKSVETWVIVLCVVLGLFLLIPIICILKKCGFFERQKVHHIRGASGNMKQLSQPDPDEDKDQDQD